MRRRVSRWIMTVFNSVGSRPELVFRSGFRCGGRDFSMDDDVLKLAQLSTVRFQDSDSKPEVVF